MNLFTKQSICLIDWLGMWEGGYPVASIQHHAIPFFECELISHCVILFFEHFCDQRMSFVHREFHQIA